jgi:hypothetical protein
MVALMACSTATFAQWYVNKKTNGMIHVTKTKSFQQMAQKGSCEIVKFDQGGSSEKITIPIEFIELANNTMTVLEKIGSYTVYVDCPNNTLVFTNNTNKRLTIDIQTTGAGLTEQFPVEAAPGQTVKRTMHANYRGKKATFYKCRLNTCNGYKRENNSQVYK